MMCIAVQAQHLLKLARIIHRATISTEVHAAVFARQQRAVTAQCLLAERTGHAVPRCGKTARARKKRGTPYRGSHCGGPRSRRRRARGTSKSANGLRKHHGPRKRRGWGRRKWCCRWSRRHKLALLHLWRPRRVLKRVDTGRGYSIYPCPEFSEISIVSRQSLNIQACQ
jgi:hypothetical protein